MRDESVKMCECGCGKAVSIFKVNNKSRGKVKGQPCRFIQGHNFKQRGPKSCLWKGGRRYLVDGRVAIYDPEHPRSDVNGYVRRSILRVEKVLGKPLPKGAIIHHADRNNRNDANSNLVVCDGHSYHGLLHSRQRSYDACGNATWRRCTFCKQYDKPENLFLPKKRNGSIYHSECVNKYQRDKRKRIGGSK